MYYFLYNGGFLYFHYFFYDNFLGDDFRDLDYFFDYLFNYFRYFYKFLFITDDLNYLLSLHLYVFYYLYGDIYYFLYLLDFWNLHHPLYYFFCFHYDRHFYHSLYNLLYYLLYFHYLWHHSVNLQNIIDIHFIQNLSSYHTDDPFIHAQYFPCFILQTLQLL